MERTSMKTISKILSKMIYLTISIFLIGLLIDINHSTSISDYLNITVGYFNGRNISVLCQLTCFTSYENIIITRELSSIGYQLKFISTEYDFVYTNSPIFGTVIDLDCEGHARFLNKANNSSWFLSNINFWLLIKSDNILRPIDFLNNFQNYYFSPISEILFVIRSNELWTVWDVYKVSKDNHLILNNISINYTENISNGIRNSIRSLEPTTRRRSNLRKIYIRSAVVITFPELFTNYDDISRVDTDVGAKLSHRIVNNLKHDLNFSLALVQIDEYGYRGDANGSYKGITGLIQRREVEFGSYGALMRRDKFEFMEFTAELNTLRGLIIYRQPPLSVVSNIFVLPFHKNVWISIIITILLTVIYMLFLFLHPNENIDLTPLDTFTLVSGVTCQQSFHLSMETTSGRILLVTVFISSLAIFTAYSAKIYALLQSPSQAITTIAELTKSPLRVGVLNVQYFQVYYEDSKARDVIEFYEEKIKPYGNRSLFTARELVERIRVGMFAGHVESHSANKLISDTYEDNEKCGLSELEPFRYPIMAIPVIKNSTYKELFRVRLRWQREIGLMHREFTVWFPKKPKCESAVGTFIPVTLVDVGPALKLLGFGVLLAIGIFIVEISFFYIKCYTNKRNNF